MSFLSYNYLFSPPPPSARHYNSTLSIWLSVDPMADKYPGLSPYAYCANNPVKLVDPDGRTYFEVEGERKQINDGNDDVTILNVTQWQFNRLQKSFKNNNLPKYNRLYNKYKNHNGYIEMTSCGGDFIIGDEVYVLPGVNLTRHSGEPYPIEKFWKFIRKIDEGGSGDYFDRKCAEAVEPFAMGLATINPLVGLPNAVKVIIKREDIYGVSSTKMDIGMAWISIGLTASESAIPELKLFNLIYNVLSGSFTGYNYYEKKQKE